MKTAGKLNPPPPQAEFDKLPLPSYCGQFSGVYYRLHGLNSKTGAPWDPVHFSRRGTTRFDPVNGSGTFYVGESLAGVLMEVFDDSWGQVGSVSRSITKTQLQEWWVTLVAVPSVTLFAAQSAHLSKIGTDLQLLTGDYVASREWALSLASHPAKIDGIYYPSRHADDRCNLAIFNQRGWAAPQSDKNLLPPAANHVLRTIGDKDPIVCGPAIMLRDHPELKFSLIELEVPMVP